MIRVAIGLFAIAGVALLLSDSATDTSGIGLGFFFAFVLSGVVALIIGLARRARSSALRSSRSPRS